MHQMHDQPVSVDAVLSPFPPAPAVDASDVAAAVEASGRRLVVLDDDPTGTQTVADIPVLTRWGTDDLRWALRQDAPGFFVLTNSRSLASAAALARNTEIVDALVAAAAGEDVDYVVASRSDSTLRGHYRLETDELAATIGARAGRPIDGVIVAPAYIEGGRITVDSVHWVRGPGGLSPVGQSEFARDATFGYRSSDLRDYVEEKSKGHWKASDVARITLADLRGGDLDSVTGILSGLTAGRPVVVDAACDEDLRILSLAILEAEAGGRRFLYRVGPSFVRARLGLRARPPLDAADIAAIRARTSPAAPEEATRGLVVVGSHVGQTTRALEGLRRLGGLHEIVVDVRQLLLSDDSSEVVGAAADEAVAALAESDVVISTSRELVTGADADASLGIARTVSAAVVAVVADVARRYRLGWIVAKGGITSSDVATEGLGIRRAWARGTLLPGIISLWEPVVSDAPPVPYVVFAGNVGDDGSLAAVVTTLRGSEEP
jgi:uncharacterized protein YgbK (DUF1537 family)